MKNIFFIGLVSLAFALNSCTKEFQPEKTNDKQSFASIENQKISIREGRLCFKDRVEFQKAVEAVTNKKEVKSDEFISRRRFLETSITLKSGTADTDSHIDDSDSLVYSDAFCSVLNANHEVQIGEILVKVTPIGTILINAGNSKLLKKIEFTDKFLAQCVKTNNAFGIVSESDLYENTVYRGVYLFDTYSKLKKGKVAQTMKVYSVSSSPQDTDFDVISDGQTWAGTLISSIIGFAKSEYKRFSSSSYCVDVKFYSQNFLVVSEAAIKVKTQKQGWTGFWSKVESDELVGGYDRLILTEKWPSKLFPSITDVTAKFPKSQVIINGLSKTYYDFRYTQQKLADEEIMTRNILGIDIDITNKDVSRALWRVLEPTWKWGNSTFGSTNNQKVALRVLEENLQKSKTETFDKSIREANTDKLTYILKRNFGCVISLPGSSSVNWLKLVQGVAANYHYEKGTVLYGCARRGNEWRGIKMVID